ncbi:MAG: chromate efflux transporter [Alphaproteobacteria bacterium]|nr:chromate efflux transporter [Alphaproteobacteria bacterium]
MSEEPIERHPAPAPDLGGAFRVWLKIGLLSFGGPAGQIAMMHRTVVEELKWIDEARFLHALNYCMLLPGPEAQQLATYIGWLMHRTVGGLIAGLLFIIPGALVMLGLSIVYVLYADLPLVDAAFMGVKAAVLIVVVEAVLRIGKRALQSAAMVAMAGAAFVAIFAFSAPFPLIVAGAGLIGCLGGIMRPGSFVVLKSKQVNADGEGSVIEAMAANGGLDHTRPSLARVALLVAVFGALWLGPIGLLMANLGPDNVFSQQAVFFSKLAVVTFGGAYAVLAYMAQQAVEAFGWMTPKEMLDGLGLAETTPGPLILVTQFVGFLGAYRHASGMDPVLAGVIGSVVTLWVTFTPCFLWIFLGAPYVEKLRDNVHISAALSGITAAVVGVVLNLAVWFGLHVSFASIGEISTLGITLPTPNLATANPGSIGLTVFAGAMLLWWHQGVFRTLLACAVLGMGLSLT